MNKYEHAYITINGCLFCDYDLYTDRPVKKGWFNGSHAAPDYTFLGDDLAFHALKPKYDKLISAPKGSSLYITPKCPIAIDDIRRNYTIKRTVDAGDYNVVCTPKNPERRSNFFIESNHLAISISAKILTLTEYEPKIDYLQSSGVPIKDEDDFTVEDNKRLYRLYFYQYPPIYKMMLDGTVKKPIISVDQLDLSSDLNLTTDVLSLVYHTAKSDGLRKDVYNNTLLQLKSLNQHDWRKYPGTMILLFNKLLAGTVIESMKSKKSQLPKEIQSLLMSSSNKYPYWKTEEDFALSRNFVRYLLNLGDGVKFVSYKDFCSRACDLNLGYYTISKLFDCCLRIKDKELDNVQEES